MKIFLRKIMCMKHTWNFSCWYKKVTRYKISYQYHINPFQSIINYSNHYNIIITFSIHYYSSYFSDEYLWNAAYHRASKLYLGIIHIESQTKNRQIWIQPLSHVVKRNNIRLWQSWRTHSFPKICGQPSPNKNAGKLIYLSVGTLFWS